jgi:hypothetical protein
MTVQLAMRTVAGPVHEVLLPRPVEQPEPLLELGLLRQEGADGGPAAGEKSGHGTSSRCGRVGAAGVGRGRITGPRP